MSKNNKKDDPVELRYEAFHTYQKWAEGCASSYLRQKYQGVGEQPAAFERWFYDAPKLMLVPGVLKKNSVTDGSDKRIARAAKALSEAGTWKEFLASVDDMPTMARLGEKLGLDDSDIPLLTALAAVAISVGAQSQAATCGHECPYSHGLGCLLGGNCTLPAGHKGKHSDKKHNWS